MSANALEQEASYGQSGAQYQSESSNIAPFPGRNASGVTMAEITREEIDAKLATVKAEMGRDVERILGRVETLASEIRGDFKELRSEFDGDFKETRATLNGLQSQVSSTKTNIWAAAAVVIAALALVVAVALVVGPWAFGFGTQLKDMVDHSVESHSSLIQAPAKK